MLKLHVVIASTRPGRGGPAVADWFLEIARADPRFVTRAVDLDEIDLPLLDEPNHPRLRQYQNEHTKRWSAIVDEADAYVFVTPEYNYSPAPSLLNALDYVYHEWKYKPAGFVSYGGASGGLRSVQTTKLTVSALGMMPLPEGVSIPFYTQLIDANGKFNGTEPLQKASATMLDELARWALALKPLRG
jgi:NAD(P)H-dependent FMN reductase